MGNEEKNYIDFSSLFRSFIVTKVRLSEEKTKRIWSFLEREYLRPQVKGTTFSACV